MTYPLVSVITTVYNCDRYLRESINSILNQDFHDFEFVIINDGSTDSCDEIINSFKDERIRYFNFCENKKLAARRNEAISYAKSEIVAIHDGDDISLPNRLSTQYSFLQQNSDIFCVGGWAFKIDVDGKDIGKMSYPPDDYETLIRMLIRTPLNPVIDPTTMFRKQDFINIGGYSMNDNALIVPDLDLWIRAIINGKKIINLKKYLTKYRINPSGWTAKYKVEMPKAFIESVKQLKSLGDKR